MLYDNIKTVGNFDVLTVGQPPVKRRQAGKSSLLYVAFFITLVAQKSQFVSFYHKNIKMRRGFQKFLNFSRKRKGLIAPGAGKSLRIKQKEPLQNKFTIAICTIVKRNVGANAHVGPPSEKFFLKSGPM